jgi:hypothetical protein
MSYLLAGSGDSLDRDPSASGWVGPGEAGLAILVSEGRDLQR